MIRLILVFVLFFSCTSSKDLSQDTIPFQTITQDYYGGLIDSKFIVIEDVKSLDEVYDLLSKGKSPKLEAPKINFDNETIIALFLGEKTSGGYSISVEKVVNYKDSIVVNYKTETPKKGEMVTSVMTQPYCIIKMPKTLKTIVFNKN